MSKSAKRWAIGTLIAAAAGYVAGILTAPKSGKETRKDIKDAAEQGMAEAEKQLKKLHTQMNDVLAQAKEKVLTLRGVAQKELQMAIDRTSAAKEKARELLSSLHEGDANDKDLKKAIQEANKALDHLKRYVQK
ncbi:MAG TPA: YtxH domain-containing protein [Candidatus Saccharimonadales bacterium]